ncbi:10201_t:CDS:2 [Entrophospora sp. SA101]|nr:10201_t:CDS:2 [Entrophospora sp. SA101]
MAVIQGLLFSLDGFVTALLKSPFNQMCYAINKSEGISNKKKDYIITKATESNEHCKETLKKFGIITIAGQLLTFIAVSSSEENKLGEYGHLMVISYLVPILFAALDIYLIHKELRKIKKNVKTRFAPSPTGELHIGGARTALFNYLLAQQNSGLKPDESIFQVGEYGPYQQTQRLDIYYKYINKLLKEKKVYYCFCSPEELTREKEEYIRENKRSNYQYSRKCLQLSENEIESFLQTQKPYVLRLKIPPTRSYFFRDLVRGEVKFAGKDIEDFVICRSNGTPLLNFVVVIDDYCMKISHVLRGEEHLSNTSKQLVLYEAQLRSKGYLPPAIVNYLLFLGWHPGSTQEFFTLAEAIKQFNLKGLNASGAVYDLEKLG